MGGNEKTLFISLALLFSGAFCHGVELQVLNQHINYGCLYTHDLFQEEVLFLFFSLFGSNPPNCPIIILTEPSLDYCVMWTQLGAKCRRPYSAIFPIKCLILAVKNLLSMLHKFRCPFTVTLCGCRLNHIEFYKYITGTYSKPSVCGTLFKFVFFY